MCLQVRRPCFCGRNSAFLSFRDNLLTPQVLVNLFCPACQGQAKFNQGTMLADCGWVLEYDMPRAQALLRQRGVKSRVTPQTIFDEGYLTWLGLSPRDQEVNTRLHKRLAPLIDQDLHLYLATLKAEWLAHVAALKTAGWRKAQNT